MREPVEQTSPVADQPVRATTEQWFRGRGLPHFEFREEVVSELRQAVAVRAASLGYVAFKAKI